MCVCERETESESGVACVYMCVHVCVHVCVYVCECVHECVCNRDLRIRGAYSLLPQHTKWLMAAHVHILHIHVWLQKRPRNVGGLHGGDDV